MVEFVNANPTGPLTVGHGRNAVLGDAVARLLTAAGYNVTREYYFNDAGRQMRVLGASRSRRVIGLPNEFPEDGYQGGYMYDIAQSMIDEAGDGFKDAELDVFRQRAPQTIFADIDATLQRIGIRFDSYYNEHETCTRKGWFRTWWLRCGPRGWSMSRTTRLGSRPPRSAKRKTASSLRTPASRPTACRTLPITARNFGAALSGW